MKLRLCAVVVILAALAAPTFAKTSSALTPRPHLAEIIRDSAKYGVDPILIASVAFNESRYIPDSFDARQNVFGGVAKAGPNATEEATECVSTIKKYYANALAAL